MKLYQIPRGTKVRLLADVSGPPGCGVYAHGDEFKLKNIDGMYSYCLDNNGDRAHLPAYAEVEVVT